MHNGSFILQLQIGTLAAIQTGNLKHFFNGYMQPRLHTFLAEGPRE